MVRVIYGESKMKLITKLLMLLAFLGTQAIALSAIAAELPNAGLGHARVYLASEMTAPVEVATPANVAQPAVQPAPRRDLVLNGDAKCTICHDESDSPELMQIGQTKHGVRADGRTPTCTSCHGESLAHLGHKGSTKPPKPDRMFGKNTTTPAAERNVACLTCHKSDAKRHLWTGSKHETNGVACTSCHKMHTAHDNVRDKKTQPEVCYACHKEQRAQEKRISHHPIGEGKVACSDCHNSHGSAGPKLLKKNTLNETCYTCHTEKRGPFLWEHQPVTEDCGTCHTPHGSNIAPLLKSRAPFMCTECHDGPHNSKVPAAGSAGGIQAGLTQSGTTATGLPSENYTGRACQNCHSMVHGSNHPAGALLHR
jgi:DmsE family decaheme c-type cytochrome